MATPKDVSKAITTAGNTKPATRSTLSSLLDTPDIKKRFNEVLGQKAPGFISSIISAVNTNPNLREADPMSVISSAAIAASLDLPINPSLGFAHIVPYSGKAQFQIGWRGLVQLAMRSGQYKTMNVAEVYEGEIVKANRITGEMEFDQEGKKSDVVLGYVAYFKLLNGFEKYYYMTKAEVERHGKRYSKSFTSDNGRWKLDFDAMAKKTVLKMLLSKFGVLSIAMEKAIQTDQAVVEGDGSLVFADNSGEVIEAETVVKTDTEAKTSPVDNSNDAIEPQEKLPEFGKDRK